MRSAVAVGLVAACGGQRAAPDAARTDAGVNVTLTATDQGKPLAGITVYFQGADSSLVAEAITDASGRAGAPLSAPGAFVTAVIPPITSGGSDRLATFGDVQPGDALRLDLEPPAGPQITVHVVVPSDPGATQYELLTSCGSSGITATSPFDVTLAGCGGALDAAVVSSDGVNPLHALYQPDLAVSDGATLTITGTYQPLATSSLSYANVPVNVATLAIEQDLGSTRGPIAMQFANVTPAGGSATASLAVPVGLANAITFTSLMPASGNSYQMVIDWAQNTGSYALDLGAVPLREYATPPAYDAPTHSVRWTEPASGGVPDYVIATCQAYRASKQWQWTLANVRDVAPAVAFPLLPTDGFDYNTADNVTVQHLLSVTVPGGYPAVRAAVLDGGFRGLVSGASGRAIVEDIYVAPM